ncbi:MAG: rhodanese-like domain-containing protein [Thermoanaerobaculia bacterium]|nr:rhodanese-like domain-containing protein [Thermoanaerobaculia bacterium]
MAQTASPRVRSKQLVTASPDQTPDRAASFFHHRLAFETDPSDVHHDQSHGVADFVVLDARQVEAFEACRVPGAIHMPHGRIRQSTTRDFDRGQLIVTYCWGPGCNAATKAAAKLSALGFRVREMIGGLEYWRREGHPVEGHEGNDAPLAGS